MKSECLAKKLSVQANAAVDDIRIIVTNLIENSSQAVQRMQEVQSIIIHQALNIQKTGQVFEAVKDGIQTSTEHIRTVITKADRMEEAREDMIDAVQSSAAAAQENAASIEEMMASVEMVYHELASITEKTNALGQLSAETKEHIAIFKTAAA